MLIQLCVYIIIRLSVGGLVRYTRNLNWRCSWEEHTHIIMNSNDANVNELDFFSSSVIMLKNIS